MDLIESKRKTRTRANDNAVSPVIAVILMVAITVVLAATVFVWVSGLQDTTPAPTNAAARATAQDVDNNGATEWIRIQLTSGGPFTAETATTEILKPDGSTTNTACETANQSGGSCAEPFAGTDGWATGESLWIPCSATGSHTATVTVQNTVILDARLDCGEGA